jgi:hypothetical protein
MHGRVLDRRAHELVGRGAEGLGIGLVGEAADEVGVPVAHRAGHVVGHVLAELQGAQLLFGGPLQGGGALHHQLFEVVAMTLQLGLDALALGDVAAVAQHQEAAAQRDVAGADLHIHLGAIGPLEAGFDEPRADGRVLQLAQQFLARPLGVPVPDVQAGDVLFAAAQQGGKAGLAMTTPPWLSSTTMPSWALVSRAWRSAASSWASRRSWRASVTSRSTPNRPISCPWALRRGPWSPAAGGRRPLPGRSGWSSG